MEGGLRYNFSLIDPIVILTPHYNILIYIGDLVYLQLLGKKILFLNSYEVATDIMEKKVCSSRPHSEMGEL